MPNNGNPTTEEVVDFYRKCGLKIKLLLMEDKERFAMRGYTRNDQVKMLDEDTEYVVFSDCDMVYELGFWKEVSELIMSSEDRLSKMISVGRWSNKVQDVDQLIDCIQYPSLIEKTADLAAISNRKMGNVGAGYFQMVHKNLLNGYYIEGNSRDFHMFNKGLNPKSDLQFKKRFQKWKLSTKKKQFHLNHERDPEAGKHLEIQR
jgi:hypothetical protein